MGKVIPKGFGNYLYVGVLRNVTVLFSSSSVWVDVITMKQFWIAERKQEFRAESERDTRNVLSF